jgi:hypothetical protein
MTIATRPRPARVRSHAFLAACVLILWPVAARADFCYDVTIDTRAFAGSTAGPFFIDVQLNDGSGTSDGNNTATLSDFTFGAGGSATGAPTLTGGATGSLAAGITITDSQFLNEFTQGFTPGTTLVFELMYSTNVDPGPQPDEFTFFFVDGSGQAIPTSDPVIGRNAVLLVDIDASATLFGYGGSATDPPPNGGPPIPFGTPDLRACPEPGSLALIVSGIVGFLGHRRLRQRWA